MGTKIPWTDETINPLQDTRKGENGIGWHCTKITTGCQNCYAESMNNFRGNHIPFDNKPMKFEIVQSALDKLKSWKKPRRIFVQSMGDLFHKYVMGEQIEHIINSLFDNEQHTYIILTKRPDRLLEWTKHIMDYPSWSSNIHIGVSISTQKDADELIPILLDIPAERRIISFEPALERINLVGIDKGISGIIMGCESGNKRRECLWEWAIYMRHQCTIREIPFFLKQMPDKNGKVIEMPELDGKIYAELPD